MPEAIEETVLEVCFGLLFFAAGAAVLLFEVARLAVALLAAADFAALLLGAVDLALLLFADEGLALLFGAARVALGPLLFEAAGLLALRVAVPPLPFLPAMFGSLFSVLRHNLAGQICWHSRVWQASHAEGAGGFSAAVGSNGWTGGQEKEVMAR